MAVFFPPPCTLKEAPTSKKPRAAENAQVASLLLMTALLLSACAATSSDKSGDEDEDVSEEIGDGDGDGDESPLGDGDGDAPGDGDGDTPNPVTLPGTGIVPLYTDATPLEIEVLEDTGTALITRFGDRGRDRHAREDHFKAYDHYLSHYWEHRTVNAEIIDTIPYGGSTITFNVTTEYKLHDNQAELRFFYLGTNTVAEYRNNGVMTPIDDLHYTRSVSVHALTEQPLKVGDHMEFELSQFLDPSVEAFGGRANYYGTTYLYVVGQGLIPWQANVAEGDEDNCPCEGEISYPIPEQGWLGGRTTLPYQYTDEPRDHFMQMATNLAGHNAQPFVLGRRLIHTDFKDGHHTERRYPEEPGGAVPVNNPVFEEQVGKLGPLYINNSCDDCHEQNTRALPPEIGTPLHKYVFKVGDEEGNPDPYLGSVFQPGESAGYAEGSVSISSYTEENGLRRPHYTFSGDYLPQLYSARIAPPLVGMGLLEAIREEDILALTDPNDGDGNGISGVAHVVFDPVTSQKRLGRFGYKAAQASVAHQSAAALRTDMGVLTGIYPDPDCGAVQQDCGPSGAELSDADLSDLVKYISLLGVRARRALNDPTALHGEQIFSQVGCADCHHPTFTTSPYHPLAELRSQVIHPYTDLLLHDMGEGLSDPLPEGQASGAEWRTPPLWSIGLTKDVNAGEAYLHDGRARTLDEAIRWHGGEGQNANNAYMALSADEKAALITFLRSL